MQDLINKFLAALIRNYSFPNHDTNCIANLLKYTNHIEFTILTKALAQNDLKP